MKTWQEVMESNIGNKIGIFPSERDNNMIDSVYDIISPITNKILDIIVNTKNKHVILLFPDTLLRPIPLIAYTLTKMNRQNTLVFTQDYRSGFKNLKVNHYKNYCLLSSKNKYNDRTYVFYDFPIYYYEKNKIIAEPYAPNADRSQKSKIKSNFKRNLDIDTPKIFIQNNSKELLNTIKGEETELLSNFIKNKKKKVPYSNLIFENFDKYTKSKERCDNFIKWINSNPNSKCIMHFSKENRYIEYLKDNLDCVIIPFNWNVINNSNLKNESRHYFEDLNKTEHDAIKKYNIDQEQNHTKKKNIKILDEKIDSANMDNYFKNLVYIINNKINHDKIVKKNLFYALKHYLYSLSNLSVNPSSFKIYLKIYSGSLHLTFREFTNMYLNALERENEENRIYLENIIFTLSNLYNQLSRRKRYDDKKSYSKIGKDYKILEIAANKKKYFKNNNDLIIATLFRTEPRIINETLQKEGIENVEAIYIENLGKNSFNRDKSKYNLLVPGVVKQQFFNELNENYKKILFITYDGKHNELVQSQIDKFSNSSMEDEMKYMTYFEELYDYVKLPKNDKFMNNYKRRRRNYLKQQKAKIESGDAKIQKIDDNKPITIQTFLDDWESSEVKRRINYSSTSKPTKRTDEKTIIVHLKNIHTNTIEKKEMPISRTYFSFTDGESMNEGEEKFPINFEEGEHIVLIEGNERKSLLDVINDLNPMNINSELIEYWKIELINYITHNRLKYKKFYDIYVKNGGERHYQTVLKWAKGEVIGPMSGKDLELIGKTINDDFIIDNHEVMMYEIGKIRSHHKHFGRKLKKIIREVMTYDKINVADLSQEEYDIYKYIENGIYEVIKIENNDINLN